MKNIGVYGCEAFPVYELHEPDIFDEIEVDEAVLEKWRKAFDNFFEVQKEIVAELKKQGHGDNIWFDTPWNGNKISS